MSLLKISLPLAIVILIDLATPILRGAGGPRPVASAIRAPAGSMPISIVIMPVQVPWESSQVPVKQGASRARGRRRGARRSGTCCAVSESAMCDSDASGRSIQRIWQAQACQQKWDMTAHQRARGPVRRAPWEPLEAECEARSAVQASATSAAMSAHIEAAGTRASSAHLWLPGRDKRAESRHGLGGDLVSRHAANALPGGKKYRESPPANKLGVCKPDANQSPESACEEHGQLPGEPNGTRNGGPAYRSAPVALGSRLLHRCEAQAIDRR
ncbi:hypothetical protein ABH941_007309 [Streptacidiphilus sp. EB103A]